MERRSFLGSLLGLCAAGFVPKVYNQGGLIHKSDYVPALLNGTESVISKTQLLKLYDAEFVSQQTMREIYENPNFTDYIHVDSVHLLHS
jgi:hypothetical protein